MFMESKEVAIVKALKDSLVLFHYWILHTTVFFFVFLVFKIIHAYYINLLLL